MADVVPANELESRFDQHAQPIGPISTIGPLSTMNRPRLLHSDGAADGSSRESIDVRTKLPLAFDSGAATTSANQLDGALAADPPLYPTPEFLTELAKVSESLETATPQAILKWAADRFGSKFTMATAFGAEGMTIIHMLAEIAPTTPIFNLETGYQFPETLALAQRVKSRYGIDIELKRPALSVEEYERINGGPVYTNDPNRCCADRKLAVLREAARGMHAWASAIRRDQSADRAVSPIVGWDRKFQLVKISPLANWTKKEVWNMISKFDIPYNPLHDLGYQSIGCWPCTRMTSLGEDERAGRWSGTAKTECGLHTQG